MSPQDAATERLSITVPAPQFAGATTAAHLLRAAAGKLRDGHPITFVHIREGVAQLCEDAATELDRRPDPELIEHYRDVDEPLLALTQHLDYALARRIRQLVAADAVAHRVIDAEQRAQRAEDLATEVRRQLRSRERQLDRALAAAGDQS